MFDVALKVDWSVDIVTVGSGNKRLISDLSVIIMTVELV